MGVYLGCKKIYILGVELNGIAYLMSGNDSHFSGKDSNYNDHKSWNYARDMNTSSRSIRQWHKLSEKCKMENIELVNLTNTGLLDFIPYENPDDLFDR